MPRRWIPRVTLLMSLVAFLGGVTVAGQSAQTKPAPKKSPTKASPDKTTATSKPAPAPADLKISTKYTIGAQVSENTTYVKGPRQRVEFPGAVTIQQCDLGRTLLINPASKTYLVQNHGEVQGGAPTIAAPAAAVDTAVGQKAPPKPEGGLINYTTTVTDTGERKQMFGREARRITTVISKEASASACDKGSMTVEVDGWYVDVPPVMQCPIRPAQAPPAPPRPDSCADRIDMRTKGEAKLGFPVASMSTTRIGEGDKQETTTSAMEVTELQVATLDGSLFEVPPGYTEAKTNAELMSGFQVAGGLSEALLGSTADGTSTAAPKGAGAIRIGVLEPVDKSAHNLPTHILRHQLGADFRKAPFEAVTLAGSSVADSQADAERMQCDYVLSSEITDIKTSKSGKVGGMLKKVTREGPAGDVHEVKLDYRLYRVGSAPTTPAFADTAKASDGGGFDVHSALKVAMVAGSMYLRFSGLGLLNPMLMPNFGGGLGPLANTGLFDPRLSAMSSLTQLATPAGVAAMGGSGVAAVPGATPGGGDSQAEIRRVVDTALANAAKGAMEQLRKKTGTPNNE